MKVNDETIEQLVKSVNGFEELLDRRDVAIKDSQRAYDEISSLKTELEKLRSEISSTEYRTRKERVEELNAQERRIEDIKKLEYNKGYAAAYTEITQRMKS